MLHQWVKDDPWGEMEKSSGGGVLLYRRILAWSERIESEINDQSNTSPSVKSAMRQLRIELEKHGTDLKPYGETGGMNNRETATKLYQNCFHFCHRQLQSIVLLAQEIRKRQGGLALTLSWLLTACGCTTNTSTS